MMAQKRVPRVIPLLISVVVLLGIVLILPTTAYAKNDSDSQKYDVTRAKEGEGYPIIVLPGYNGSRLFSLPDKFDDSTKIWDPPNPIPPGYGRLLEGTLFVRPPEDQRYKNKVKATQTEADREYGTLNNFKEVVDKLCDEFPDREIYFFSYDWRGNIEDSRDELYKFIKSLGAEKVDLVCHSMGGLVASSYYAEYGNEKVNKIITAGTPYEGSPKIIRQPFAAAAELTLTADYVFKQPVLREFNDKYRKIGYCEYISILKDIFPGENIDMATAFKKSLKDNKGFNKLLRYPNAWFAMGIGQKTISTVAYHASDDGTGKLYESDLLYDIKGDGNIPCLSASAMKGIDKLPPNRWCRFKTTHGGTIGHHEYPENATGKYKEINDEADKSLHWIVDILKTSSSGMSSAKFNNNGYLVIRAAYPVDIVISHGEETLAYSSAQQRYILSSSFGRMDILGSEDDIKVFCLDDYYDYDIVIDGTDNGTMDFELRVFDKDNNLISGYGVYDVPVNENTHITTTTDYRKPIMLAVDNNGDGTVDVTLEAKKNPHKLRSLRKQRL